MLVKLPEHDPLPEPENGDSDGRPSLYWLIFLILLSSRIWWKTPDLDMSGVLNATNVRIGVEALAIATGWTAALALTNHYIWPAFVAWFVAPQQQAAEKPKPEATPPAPSDDEPRQAQQTAVPQTADWVLIGNKPIYLSDYGVSKTTWQWLENTRKEGKLPTISPTSLKDNFGFQDEAATRLNDALLKLGLIRDGGHRQPNKWTALGNQVLPASPTPRQMVH